MIKLGPVSDYASALRYHLTLRNTSYLKLLLFRFPSPLDALHPTEWNCMQADCPHLGADLSHAPIEDVEDGSKILTCPWHEMDFDLATGQSLSGMKACVFQISVRDDQLFLDVADSYQLVSARAVSESFACNSQLPSLDTLQITEKEPVTLTDWACLVLRTAAPELKVKLTRQVVERFRTGKLKQIGRTLPPDEPARASFLSTVEPGKVIRRGKGGSLKSRISLLHSLANIEQWAIDLAFDVIARFPTWNGKQLPLAFFSDFLKVAEDEAKHFTLLRARLEALGSGFGQFPVHGGLWQSARDTFGSLSARLCIIHLVHESRGLDVNPTQIQRFREAGDADSVETLTTIHHDEITHVMAGHRWLQHICKEDGLDPILVFRTAVQEHFYGSLKPPFNEVDRTRAGLSPDYYIDLQGKVDKDFSKPLQTATAGG